MWILYGGLCEVGQLLLVFLEVWASYQDHTQCWTCLEMRAKSDALGAECLLGQSALSAECTQVLKICCALSAECTQSAECWVQWNCTQKLHWRVFVCFNVINDTRSLTRYYSFSAPSSGKWGACLCACLCLKLPLSKVYVCIYVYSQRWPLRKQRFQPSMSFLKNIGLFCRSLLHKRPIK